MAREAQQEEVLTLLKAAEELRIKRRTLFGWLHEAGMEPTWVDGKNKGITRTQFNHLAFRHGRIPHASISAADWDALVQRVTILEQQVAALTKVKGQE